MEQLMLLQRFHLRIFIISCYISLFFIPYSAIGQNCELLCNGSFDSICVACPGSVNLVHDTLVPCWHTTESDSIIEVWGSGFNGVPSYSGVQFVELNAWVPATLYQDFTVTPGSNIYIGFAHRGRNGVDSMSVSIGPVGGPYVTLGTYGDNNTAWGYYIINYTVPSSMGSQYSLRFTSVYATGGVLSIGNFLDAISVSLQSFSATISSTPASCGFSNGTATVNPSGGTGLLTYFWSPTGGTGATASGLSPGLYTVVITDSIGCNMIDSVIVANTGGPSVGIASISGISCFGGNDGMAIVSVIGGTIPYTYSWSPSGGNNDTAAGLTSGMYCVTVTDFNLCDTTICLIITEPSPLIISLSSTPSACGGSDGTATVDASGGSGSYTYSWSPVGGNGATANNLPAGIYTVIVIDSTGCSLSDSVEVGNTGGAALSITDSSMVSCKGGNDGSATVTPSGGTPAYTYSWNTSPAQTDSTATGLTAGFYNVTVTDDSGCVSIISTNISEPDSIIVTISDSIMICLGDSAIIDASASGGTGPYTYAWDNGLGSGDTQVVSPDSTTTYTVSVTDANLCTGIDKLVTISIKPTTGPLSVTVSGSTTICFGDNATISAIGSGGDGGPYTYVWNNGADTGNPVLVSPAITTTYTVTISDACNSSTSTDSVTISVNTVPVAGFEVNPIETTIINPVFDFQDQSSQGVVFWYWDFGDGDTANIANPTHTYSDTGRYPVMLVVTNSAGCRDSTVQYVIVTDTYILFAPSAFLPNSIIEENMSFLPKGIGFQNPDFEMYIYNRWGEEIFRTNDANSGWDGRTKDSQKIVQQDVYVWLIKTKEKNGKRHLYVGHVTLIR